MEANKDTTIVGSFDLTTNLPSATGGQIVFHGYLYAADKSDEINARIDQLQDVAKRQFERSGIEMRVAERAKHVDNLTRVLQIYDALVEKKKQGIKFNSQEKQQYEAGETTIKAAREQIQKIEEGIAEAKKKVGIT
jgi:gamma-glutamylcyclotransferase (GGCT)/AIG2-like uncharacterized protein YtfP